jgi:hypothetical protein
MQRDRDGVDGFMGISWARRRAHQANTSILLVGGRGIEPLTPSMSMERPLIGAASRWGIEPYTKQGTTLDYSSRANCGRRVGKELPIATIRRMGELERPQEPPKRWDNLENTHWDSLGAYAKVGHGKLLIRLLGGTPSTGTT